MKVSDEKDNPARVVMLQVQIAALPELEVRDALLIECTAGGAVLDLSVPLSAQTRLALRLPTEDGGATLRAVVVKELEPGLVAVRWLPGAGERAEAALARVLGHA